VRLKFPLPLLICPLSCLTGPQSDVVLEALAYRDVVSTLSRLSHSSPIHLLASQLSPIAILSHLSSPFGFFSQDRLQTCGTVFPRSPPLSLTYLPWTLSLISVAHPFPSFPSSLLSTLPLGLTLRNINCPPALPSTFVQTLHRHLFPSPEGSPRQEYQVLSLERWPRTACLSV
jgi:hypothetical protein